MSKVAAACLKYNQRNNHIILGKISFPVWFIFCSMLCQFLCVSLSFLKRRLMTTFYLLICPAIVQILLRFSVLLSRENFRPYARSQISVARRKCCLDWKFRLDVFFFVAPRSTIVSTIVWLFFRCSFVTLSVVSFFIFFFEPNHNVTVLIFLFYRGKKEE